MSRNVRGGLTIRVTDEQVCQLDALQEYMIELGLPRTSTTYSDAVRFAINVAYRKLCEPLIDGAENDSV